MRIPSLLLCLVLVLVGCETRSISDSGYQHDQKYRGELSELQVLGVVPTDTISEDDIAKALDTRPDIHLSRGQSVVFVQSGAQFPDEALMDAARKDFNPIPLSGVPENFTGYYTSGGWRQTGTNDDTTTPKELNQSLRLAAARAGADVMVVYWGIIEVQREGYATKAVSWVPIVGWGIPDESRNIRIRIKAAVIDVRSGAWEFLIPESDNTKQTTSIATRGEKHDKMVDTLKAQVYGDLIKMMETRYMNR